MRTHCRISSLLLVLALPLSCSPSLPDEDAVADPFLLPDGKTDLFGIGPGSPEAQAVLQVANTASEVVLRQEVGLTKQATTALLDWRRGVDGVAGTADDRVIQTLAELDDLPWIGKKSFQKLLAYAKAQGLVKPPPPPDPLDPQSCTGAPISTAALLARFQPGSAAATLGVYAVQGRSRICHAVTGCAPWTTGGIPQGPSFQSAKPLDPAQTVLFFDGVYGWNFLFCTPGQGQAALQLQSDGAVRLELESEQGGYDQTGSQRCANGYRIDRPDAYSWRLRHTCTGLGTDQVACATSSLAQEGGSTQKVVLGNKAFAPGGTTFRGVFTDHCFRLTAQGKWPTGTSGQFIEEEAILLATY